LVVAVQGAAFALYGFLMSWLGYEVNWSFLPLGWLVAAALVGVSPSLGIAIGRRARVAMVVSAVALLGVCVWLYASPPLVLRLRGWSPWNIPSAIGISLFLVALISTVQQRSRERSPAEWFPRCTFAATVLVLVVLHLFHQFIFLLINHVPHGSPLAFDVWIVVLATWTTLTIMWTLGSAVAFAVLVPHALRRLTQDQAALTNANLALLSVAIAVLISAAWDQSKPSGVEEAEHAPFGVGSGLFGALRYFGGTLYP